MHLLYSTELKRTLLLGLVLFSLFILFTQKSFAASLVGAKDTITTSRPSASTPLSAALGSTATQATVFNNGSRFLSSDSAKLIRGNNSEIIDAGTIIASHSAALTTVYFGEQAGIAGQAGIDILYMPITTMHTIRFTTATEIPDEGDVEILFPTLATLDADNDASPSATTFQFNNLVPGGSQTDPSNIEVYDDASGITAAVTVTETEPTAGAQGSITIEFDSGPIAAGSIITIMLGCSSASNQDTCTVQVPRIINPTKTASVGIADSWKVSLRTEDASNVLLDSAIVGIATIESVTVRATVDPTLSFTITGIDSGDDLATGNTGCSIAAADNANSGINSTQNEVNLGIVQNSPAANGAIPNLAGQYITISTNGSSGYALTATSASSLLSPENGFFFLTSTTPTNFAAASDFFGLHPCGNDVNNTWIEGAPGGGSDCTFVTGATGAAGDECYWAWPNSTNTLGGGTTLTIASDTAGPIGTGTGETGDGITSVAYAAGTDALVPPGEYRAVITYVATPSF